MIQLTDKQREKIREIANTYEVYDLRQFDGADDDVYFFVYSVYGPALERDSMLILDMYSDLTDLLGENVCLIDTTAVEIDSASLIEQLKTTWAV